MRHVIGVLIALAAIAGLEHFKVSERRERFAKCMAIKHDDIACDVYAHAIDRR